MKPLRVPPPTPDRAGAVLSSLRRRLAVAGGAWMVAMSLAACGQSVVSAPRCGAASPSAAGPRVLVSFRQATVADAPAVIEQLQALAGTCVRPVSSVSPTMHVYVVSGTVDMAVLRVRLLTWAAVRDVEADVLIRHQ
jgi:hypothetical protein